MIHLVVFPISGQGYFTFLYRYAKQKRESGRKEQTNKHGLESASAKEGSLWHSLYILWANASVYSSKNFHKATSNADSNSVPCLNLCWLSCYAPFCWLLSSGTFLPSSFRFRGISRAQTLCVGFEPKQTKGFPNWHPHTQKWMPPIVSHM